MTEVVLFNKYEQFFGRKRRITELLETQNRWSLLKDKNLGLISSEKVKT